MKSWLQILLLLAITATTTTALSQDSIKTDKAEEAARKSRALLIVPLIYVSPESGFSGGGGGILNFKFNPLDTILKPSNINTYLLFSTKGNASVEFGYDLFFKENRRQLKGDAVFKISSEEFFGIGNTINPDYDETYRLTEIGLENSFYQQFEVVTLQQKFYTGPRFSIKKWSVDEFDEDDYTGGEVIGLDPYLSVGLGILLNYDSRNDVYYPSAGSYLELLTTHYQKLWGSDYTFNNYILDLRSYHTIIPNHILAFNYYSSFNFGTVPFQLLGMLGGGKRLRGLYEGRFRDHHAITLQGEYRFPIVWRFKGALFYGLGRVAPEIDQFNLRNWRQAGGVGLRWQFTKKQKLHVRLDVAYSKFDGINPYITIKEAF